MRNAVRMRVRDLGRMGYGEALELQQQLASAAQAGRLARSAAVRRASARRHHGPQRARWKICWRSRRVTGARRHRVASTPIAAATSPITARARSSAIRSWICANGSAMWAPTCARIEQVLIDTLADFGIEAGRIAEADRRLGGRATRSPPSACTSAAGSRRTALR